MPGKNGREVYEEITGIRQEVKVLFMSGYTAGILEEKGSLTSGFNFIGKPAAPEKLIAKLREILDKQAVMHTK